MENWSRTKKTASITNSETAKTASKRTEFWLGTSSTGGSFQNSHGVYIIYLFKKQKHNFQEKCLKPKKELSGRINRKEGLNILCLRNKKMAKHVTYVQAANFFLEIGNRTSGDKSTISRTQETGWNLWQIGYCKRNDSQTSRQYNRIYSKWNIKRKKKENSWFMRQFHAA